MRVLVVGAGVVGSDLARQFAREGHDVVVVDRDHRLIRQLTERLDVMALAGDGTRLSVLREAGVEDADLVVAVTPTDSINLVICATAGRFDVAQKIARVRCEEIARDPEDFYRRTFSVDRMINPTGFIADRLADIARIPGCVDVAHFVQGDVMLCGFLVDAGTPLTTGSLSESRARHAGLRYLVVALERRGELVIPRGPDRPEAGDKAYVILPRAEVERFAPLVSRARPSRDPRVVLVAGSSESERLATALEARGLQVAVIERDRRRARREAEALRHGTVFEGEATDLDLLDEARVDRADLFLAAGSDEESNLFAAMLARREGARRTAVFTLETEHLGVLHSIGIDVVINPRLETAGAILHLVRRGSILQVARLGHTQAEAIEYELPAGAAALGRPLRDQTFPRGAIVAAVSRGAEVRIADGDTVLEPGDRAVVFALPAVLPSLERLFAAG